MENTNLNSQNKTKKIVKVIIEWFLYIIIFAAIVWGTPKALVMILHTDYPIASITSSSMWPVLKEGDVVFIRGYSGDRNDLKVGDIVVYRNDKGFTIHRIIEFRENTLITQGDANNVSDAPIGYDKVVGKMIFLGGKPLRIPLLGKLSQIFRK